MRTSAESSCGGGSDGKKMVYTSCQDCGNKAKRDCEHKRCRTCCKGRRFQCPTHVTSTWVPVARRRHRQLLHQHRYNHHYPLPLSLSTTTTSSYYPYHSPPPEGGNLPEELTSWATFKCIRVSSEDDVVDQYAYQTSIIIGGHIFKGILYYQGPTNSYGGAGVEISSAATSDNHHFHHHQFDITTVSVAASPPSRGEDLLNFHSNNALLPGMEFFPNPRT